jgi:hypothetical protein
MSFLSLFEMCEFALLFAHLVASHVYLKIVTAKSRKTNKVDTKESSGEEKKARPFLTDA